jgi:hypothetical protein
LRRRRLIDVSLAFLLYLLQHQIDQIIQSQMTDNDDSIIAAQYSLHTQIDTAKLLVYNERTTGAGAKVFKSWKGRHDRYAHPRRHCASHVRRPEMRLLNRTLTVIFCSVYHSRQASN